MASAPRWLIGLSGGRDSMVLLDLVHRWSASNPAPEMCAVHINHGLHTDAAAWCNLCQSACAERDIAFESHRVQVDDSRASGLEAAARAARYRGFEGVMSEGDILMLAHHLDDQVETVLYRLLRGAGPAGLRGMPERRRLGAGEIYRPLLQVERDRISTWARDHQIAYVDDPSNTRLSLDRNYLRLAVLPQIAERWPGYRQTVARAAELQDRLCAQLQDEPLDTTVSRCGDPGLVIDRAITPAEYADRLHRWLLASELRAPPAVRLQEYARQLLESAADRQPELLLEGWRLIGWREVVYRVPGALADVAVNLPPSVRAGEDSAGPWGALEWGACEDGLPDGIVLSPRAPHPGERLTPAGGKSRGLGQLCQEYQVPPWWRPFLPVLCLGEVPVALAGVCLLAGSRDLPVEPGQRRWLPQWKPGENASSIEGADPC